MKEKVDLWDIAKVKEIMEQLSKRTDNEMKEKVDLWDVAKVKEIMEQLSKRTDSIIKRQKEISEEEISESRLHDVIYEYDTLKYDTF